jgi:hypothetical protein
LDYLNANVKKLGVYANSTTATFSGVFLPAPTGFPRSTNQDDFVIFCNGQLIEPAAIVSFTQNPSTSTSTLVIDQNQLGYTFGPTDEIIAIGKFA